MKRLATTLMAALLLLLCAQARTVIVNNEQIEGKNVRQILFDKENVTIVYTDGTQSDLVEIGLVVLNEITGVEGVRVYSATAAVSGNALTLSGINAEQAIAVFDTKGRQVINLPAPKADKAVVNISTLASGVYVLRNGENVIKFVKR